MSERGKKYRSAIEKIDREKSYSVAETFKLVTETAHTKFDETVDAAINLGVDPKQADQTIRSAALLPHGLGKKVRVLVFTQGEKIKEAEDAGADYVGLENYIEKVKTGWLDFDKVVATPDVMGAVGKVGKILGTKGLMPNPKVGTVTFDVGRAVKEQKAGKVEFRAEKAGIVHVPIGKVSFGPQKLQENFLALMELIMKLKPHTSKGIYLKALSVSSTMGVGIKLDTNDLKNYLQ